MRGIWDERKWGGAERHYPRAPIFSPRPGRPFYRADIRVRRDSVKTRAIAIFGRGSYYMRIADESAAADHAGVHVPRAGVRASFTRRRVRLHIAHTNNYLWCRLCRCFYAGKRARWRAYNSLLISCGRVPLLLR